MIRIIDTYSKINSIFDTGIFSPTKWRLYIDSVYPGSAQIFADDLNECLEAGNYVYETDVLPIIQAVCGHPALPDLHASFVKVTDGLHEKVLDRFGRTLDIDIVLYVGLCNAAGWVTRINGRDVILLGIEKILELNWQDEDSMRGLIYHELGHVYHKQYGDFAQQSECSERRFVWQLFTEGVAMYFEQMLVNDLRYYHQDTDNWLAWCDDHFQQIRSDFTRDLPTMTASNQRYFGDWVSYHGRGDVGYYLGARFVQRLCEAYEFDELIGTSVDEVYREYMLFAESNMAL